MINDNPNTKLVRVVVRDKNQTIQEVKRLILEGHTTASAIAEGINKGLSWTRQILSYMERGAYGQENTIICTNQPKGREEKIWAMMNEDDRKVCRFEKGEWPPINPTIAANCIASFWIPRFNERAA